MKEYEKEMESYKEEMKEYNQKLQEYNNKIAEHNQEVITKKPDEKFLPKNNQINENPEYWEKYCPNLQCKGTKNQAGDKYCSECGSQLSKKKINLNSVQKENENKWNWREFWIGVSLMLILSTAIFVGFKLFKGKSKKN